MLAQDISLSITRLKDSAQCDVAVFVSCELLTCCNLVKFQTLPGIQICETNKLVNHFTFSLIKLKE